jgi:hypothetical protein
MMPESPLTAGGPAGLGKFKVEVWPIYVGLACTEGETVGPWESFRQANTFITEPINDFDYSRGMITWTTHPDGSITGRGRVHVGKGVYTHVIFAHGPTEHVAAVEKLEHPIPFDRAGFIDLDPIKNKRYLPRGTVKA